VATKTARIELRVDPEQERRIRYAADLAHTSVSAFVLEAAAAERAEHVIAASTATVAPAAWFDAVWDALDSPPQPNPALRARAARARSVDTGWVRPPHLHR
jgi:uncharacterized protein (DUF1778 family)